MAATATMMIARMTRTTRRTIPVVEARIVGRIGRPMRRFRALVVRLQMETVFMIQRLIRLIQCDAPQGTPTPSVPKPPCNTDVPKTYTTLGNLGQDVLGITAQKDAAITPADLLALVATLASDIANEMLDPTSFFQGGHFFLELSLASVAQDFGVATAAYADFVNLFDPSGNGRRYPDPVPTTDPSHKYYLHDHSVNQNQDLTFHFDRYNPNSNFPVGILGHFGVDVLYGS